MLPVHCCACFLLYFMTAFTSAARLSEGSTCNENAKRTNWLRVYLRVIDRFSSRAVTTRGALVRVHTVDNGWAIPTGWSDLSPLSRCMTIKLENFSFKMRYRCRFVRGDDLIKTWTACPNPSTTLCITNVRERGRKPHRNIRCCEG